VASPRARPHWLPAHQSLAAGASSWAFACEPAQRREALARRQSHYCTTTWGHGQVTGSGRQSRRILLISRYLGVPERWARHCSSARGRRVSEKPGSTSYHRTHSGKLPPPPLTRTRLYPSTRPALSDTAHVLLTLPVAADRAISTVSFHFRGRWRVGESRSRMLNSTSYFSSLLYFWNLPKSVHHRAINSLPFHAVKLACIGDFHLLPKLLCVALCAIARCHRPRLAAPTLLIQYRANHPSKPPNALR